jgi:hypothetical protein
MEQDTKNSCMERIIKDNDSASEKLWSQILQLVSGKLGT